MNFTDTEMEGALQIVRRRVPPTPTHAWPQLTMRTGVELYVKHENHTPTGSFKARGGLVYIDSLCRQTRPDGLVTATRGNHGQSIALAARAAGVTPIVVVPERNSEEKNAAMKAFGAELLIRGRDFDEARAIAAQEARERGFLLVPSFHREIVRGVATYGWELFSQLPDLDAVIVPVGVGTGICGLIAMRDLFGLRTEIIGVVAEQAPAFAMRYRGYELPGPAVAASFADGLACREPPDEAVAIVRRGAADVVQVSEDEIADAIRTFYETTHNLAEGAGAASLAALFRLGERYRGKPVAIILSGGNIDRAVMAAILAGDTPRP